MGQLELHVAETTDNRRRASPNLRYQWVAGPMAHRATGHVMPLRRETLPLFVQVANRLLHNMLNDITGVRKLCEPVPALHTGFSATLLRVQHKSRKGRLSLRAEINNWPHVTDHAGQ